MLVTLKEEPLILTGSSCSWTSNPPEVFWIFLTSSNFSLEIVNTVGCPVVYLLLDTTSPVTKVPVTCCSTIVWPETDFTKAVAPEVTPVIKSFDAKLWDCPAVIVIVWYVQISVTYSLPSVNPTAIPLPISVPSTSCREIALGNEIAPFTVEWLVLK